jgi:putative inorganic carbon (HCO3(-)) transporter
MLQTEFAFSSIVKNKFFILLATIGIALAIGVTGIVDPLLLLGAVAVFYLLMVLLRSPDFTVMFVIFVIYTNAAVVLTKFHGLPPLVGYAMPMLVAIPFLWHIIKNQQLKFNFVLLLMIVFLSIMVLSSAFSKDVDISLRNTTTFATEGVVLYFLFLNTVRTPKLLNRVVWTLLIAGGILGALSLYQQLTGTFDDPYWGFAQMTSRGFTTGQTLQGDVTQARASGPIGEQNRYAQVMLMLVPLGFFRVWGEPSRRLRLAALVLTALIFIGASLAFSRGGMVGFLMLIAIMTFMRYIKLQQLLVILLGIVLLFVAFPQNNVRFGSLGALFSSQEEGGILSADGALKGRATEMLVALYVFLDNPLFGVGPGMLGFEMAEYSSTIGIRNITATRESHSLYLGEAAETGGFGLITIVAIFFYTLNLLAKARTYWLERKQINMANLVTGFSLAIVSYMTTALFLHMSYLRYVWLIMALAGVASGFREADLVEEVVEQERKETLVSARELVS